MPSSISVSLPPLSSSILPYNPAEPLSVLLLLRSLFLRSSLPPSALSYDRWLSLTSRPCILHTGVLVIYSKLPRVFSLSSPIFGAAPDRPPSLLRFYIYSPYQRTNPSSNLDATVVFSFRVFPSIFLWTSFSSSRYRSLRMLPSLATLPPSLFSLPPPPLPPSPLSLPLSTSLGSPRHTLYISYPSLFIPIPILILLFWSNSQSPV